ncbi:MAG: MBL fold metallo-hydrolase [Bacillota bacterium]|nr:MBL fold metallo-hydrolase [Bacillota bacterium]
MPRLSLVQVADHTYYIPSPTNVGVYVDEKTAVLIDSGSDKDAGRQIYRLLNEQGWELKMIVNTHSNADHIGGNAFLQQKTGCAIAATEKEAIFINNPQLEAAFLCGGFPYPELNNKFLVAKPSLVTDVILSSGIIKKCPLETVPLPGHFFEMIGIKTPDGIFFSADSLFPERIIAKYHLFFLYDLEQHLQTLEKLETLEADLYIPGHGEVLNSINRLIGINRNKIKGILSFLTDACSKMVTFDELLAETCVRYNINLNPAQHVLVSSTIRSYLAYLVSHELVHYSFEDGRMIWETS